MSISYRIEHFAYMTEDPAAVAAWYCENLGFKVKTAMEKSPFTHFMSDAFGQVLIEIYNNPNAQVPDYTSIHPLNFHLAFMVDEIDPAKESLLAAGAIQALDLIVTGTGDQLLMLRDPWGLPIQLCHREPPLLR